MHYLLSPLLIRRNILVVFHDMCTSYPTYYLNLIALYRIEKSVGLHLPLPSRGIQDSVFMSINKYFSKRTLF